MRRLVLAAACLALAACGGESGSSRTAVEVSPEDAARIAALTARLDALEAEIVEAEDVSAIKRLMRTYGYYLDRGLWEDLTDLFTEDAVGSYPAGVFIGRESLHPHFLDNNGRGYLGFEEGRLGNHIPLQPVINVDPDGRTAHGRWRVLAQLGQYGQSANWAGGVYEIDYRKEDGVWKIAELEYFNQFGGQYEGGWKGAAPGETEPPRPGASRFANLPRPPDQPSRAAECPSFPTGTCIPPFHYGNPASGRPFNPEDWAEGGERQPASPYVASADAAPGGEAADAVVPADPAAALADAAARVASLRARASLQQDGRDIENLQAIYGYYLDRMLWDEIADLFAADGTIEAGHRGVYVGQDRVREFLHSVGPEGPRYGVLNDHIQVQPVIHVAPDGLTARARSRVIAMTGTYGESGRIGDGVYENEYVKEDGVWKFKSLHFFPIFMSDYDQGWGESAIASPGPSETLPPDRPSTVEYAEYPTYFAPPFHYPNPVTGEPVQYREGSTAPVDLTPPVAPPAPAVASMTVAELEAAIADAEHAIQLVRDRDEIDNLIRAYGYYLDKNMWNDLADLFSEDGSIELAQRGVYIGRERVREFLHTVFGAPGPSAGRLGDHVQVQPVIIVAEDGQTAVARSRVIQMMGFAGRSASWVGGVYVNDFVKEDGVWKFKTDHAFNTFMANYEGGWAHASSQTLPGPSERLPPDTPPTQTFRPFPWVIDIPFNYANPVTGE